MRTQQEVVSHVPCTGTCTVEHMKHMDCLTLLHNIQRTCINHF